MNGETKMDIETPSKAITLPWVEKYRPKGLSDLISHEYILKTCT